MALEAVQQVGNIMHLGDKRVHLVLELGTVLFEAAR